MMKDRKLMEYRYLILILIHMRVRIRVMVFNATIHNISVISWRSVLLVEETGVPGEYPEKTTDKLYRIMLYQVHLSLSMIRTHNLSGNRH